MRFSKGLIGVALAVLIVLATPTQIAALSNWHIESVVQVLRSFGVGSAITAIEQALRGSLAPSPVKGASAAFMAAHASWNNAPEKDRPAKLQALVAATKERKERMIEALQNGYVIDVLNESLTDEVLNTLPEEVALYVEQPVDVVGLLDIFHADIPSQNKAINELRLIVGSEKKEIYTLRFAEGSIPLSIKELRVRGKKIGNTIYFQNSNTTQQVSSVTAVTSNGNPQQTTGTINTLVILMNWSDNQAQPFSVADATNAYFGAGNGSVQGYFKESSYGQATISGKVVGWVTIPDSSANCAGFNNFTWQTQAVQAAQNQFGVTPSAYSRTVFVWPRNGCFGWAGGWGGTLSGWAPNSYAYSNGYLDLWVAGHEIGHSMHLDHAGYYNCGSLPVAPYTSCSWSEYGDPHDIMGNSGLNNQLNAAHRHQANWLAASNIQTITSSGTYTIAPLEVQTSGVQVLRIAKPDSVNYPAPYRTNAYYPEYYYVEYRQPVGSDGNMSAGATGGAMIHAWVGNPSVMLQTRLFNALPGVSTALQDGQSFVDSVNGITITQVSHNAQGVTLQVTVPGSTNPPPTPTVTLTATPSSITAGQSATLSWSSTNASSCSGTNFAVSGTSGSVVVWPTSTTVYTVTCDGVSANAQVSVASATTLARGVRVETTSNLNVRNKANNNSGKLLCTQSTGAQGTIVGGPNNGNGYVWWNVNFDTGCDGWVIQTYISKL